MNYSELKLNLDESRDSSQCSSRFKATMKLLFISLLVIQFALVKLAPAEENSENAEVDDPPARAYQYSYTVKDQEKQLFIEKTESGDDKGKVTGKFSVLLADGRLMTVEYVADEVDGFVPKISYKDNADPFVTDADNTVT